MLESPSRHFWLLQQGRLRLLSKDDGDRVTLPLAGRVLPNSGLFQGEKKPEETV
jgi:hypothetical protein